MSATAGIEPQELADRLRADSMISDAEVMLGPEPERMTALIVSKGFRFGAELRGRAMHLLGEPGGRLQVAILLKIPRCPDGSLDKEQVAAIIRRPRVLFRFEPPGTENEKNLVELLRTLLPIQLISMSDSLGDLGAVVPLVRRRLTRLGSPVMLGERQHGRRRLGPRPRRDVRRPRRLR